MVMSTISALPDSLLSLGSRMDAESQMGIVRLAAMSSTEIISGDEDREPCAVPGRFMTVPLLPSHDSLLHSTRESTFSFSTADNCQDGIEGDLADGGAGN